MAKQSQTVETKTHKPQPKPVPAPDPLGAELAPVDFALGPAGVQSRIPGSATPFNDPRLQVIQRQRLATQIGQVQGNGHLQQALGVVSLGQNSRRESTNLIQAKIAVNPPNDICEQEAEKVANRVVMLSELAVSNKEETTQHVKPVCNHRLGLGATSLQTKCVKCEAEERGQVPGKISPSVDEEKEISVVQTQTLTSPSTVVENAIAVSQPNQAPLETTLSNTKGGGNAIQPDVRAKMEEHFGADFSTVRVHTDSTAVQMNHAVQSRAFTHKNDIYFNSGEYSPTSRNGKHLLAHELTHTIQHGTNSNTVQRFVIPTQAVTTEPKPANPNDGAEVQSRMDAKINNDPNVQDQGDLSEEERQEAEHPDRSEVRQESSEIFGSGESRPSVDRGTAAQEKTETQKAQIEAAVQEQSPEAGEEPHTVAGQSVRLSEADAAAQRAVTAEQNAQATQIPDQPEPFNPPTVEAPVDSAGEPLPRNGQIDTQVQGLGYIGEMLREQGYEMKRSAAEQEKGSYEQETVIERLREDLGNAKEGTATMEAHNQGRQEIAEKSRNAQVESVARQQFVAQEAPGLASKADEGQADSSELASEARSKAGQSESEIPDDPDARADAQRQSGEMQNSAQQAETMDQAIRQTGEKARQYEQDAAVAAEQNQQSETQIAETDEIITQTQTHIGEMQAANQASQTQIENVAPGPALVRQFSQQTASSGDQLIAATYVMEAELIALQDEYLSGMAGIESREEAEQQLLEEQAEQEAPAEVSPEEQQLFALAGMEDAEQEQHIAQMEQSERDSLLATLDQIIQESPDQGINATEGARVQVDTGLSQAIMGEQPADPRTQQIQEVENNRIQRVGGVLDVADQNMNYLSETQQQMLANRLVAESITADIANINVLQMGKDMLIGMIDPRQSLTSVVGGFEKMLTGFANIGNAEAWRRDPLGNLLQVAADITTGLAMIFSTILGIAGLITALMVILTIFSWGTLSPITGPVIAWMGTVMTYAGWGALISGGLAVYFNYLTYIKNLHDAGTAETARELFGNTAQMKQNASDGFQGAMAVVEGVGAVKMGPHLSSGAFFQHVPRSPGAFARQTVAGVRQGAASVASAPGRIARGARELFEGGREGLMRFKERVQNLFRRRQPGAVDLDMDLDTPHARQQHQTQLDEARGKTIREMDEPEFRTEMQELGANRPRRIDPDSEFAQRYDVEIESNGHTYRRNRDGSGWCRFSAEECGIPEAALPDNVKQNLPEPLIDPNTGRPIGEPPEPLIDPNTGRPIGERHRRPPTEIVTESDGTLTTSDNGNRPIRTTIDPDGTTTVVNTSNGNTTVNHPDGTRIFREGNGDSITVVSPDGTTTVHRADGTQYRIDPNGITTVTRPDGTTSVAVQREAPISDTTGIIDGDARRHILEGEGPGSGGHGPGVRRPGKSEFPPGWSDERILHEISDISTDPNAHWTQQTGSPGATHTSSGKPVRWRVESTVDGVDITVIVEPHGRGVVTGFPTNVPQNPILPGSEI